MDKFATKNLRYHRRPCPSTEKIPSDMLANWHNVIKMTKKVGNREIFALQLMFYERADVNHS